MGQKSTDEEALARREKMRPCNKTCKPEQSECSGCVYQKNDIEFLTQLHDYQGY